MVSVVMVMRERHGYFLSACPPSINLTSYNLYDEIFISSPLEKTFVFRESGPVKRKIKFFIDDEPYCFFIDKLALQLVRSNADPVANLV